MADDDLRVNEILDRSEQNPSSLSPQEIFYLEVTTNHAKEHFLKSGHLYAINMDNKNVWNFSKAGYVYRLIQAEVDKLIEIEEPSSQDIAAPLTQEQQLDGKFALLSAPQQLSKKVRALESEYNGVLASQLDEQRFYFEEQLKAVKKQVELRKDEMKKEIVECSKEAERREERVVKLEEQLRAAEEEIRQQEVRKKLRQKSEQKLRCRQEELTKEKQRLFKILEERKESVQKEMQKLNEEIGSTEEMLKDLKTHIAAQKSLKGKQIGDGQMFVLGKASAGKTKKQKK